MDYTTMRLSKYNGIVHGNIVGIKCVACTHPLYASLNNTKMHTFKSAAVSSVIRNNFIRLV